MKTPPLGFLLLCLMMSLSIVPGSSQDLMKIQGENVFELRLGLKHLTMLDKNTTHLVYQGNIPSLGFGFRKIKESGYIKAEAEVGRGGIFPQKYPNREIIFLEEDIAGETNAVRVPMRGTSTPARLAIGYFHRLNSLSDFNYYLGALVSDEAYYQEGFITPGLMNMLSFSPALDLHFATNRKFSINLGISIPIVSLVTRSAYHNSVSFPTKKRFAGFWNNGTSLESLDQHRQINFTGSLYHRLGQHLEGGFTFQLSALKNEIPRQLTRIENEINLTLRYSK